MKKPSLVIYLPDLSGGGAERLHVNLTPHFLALGYEVTFLVNRAQGPLIDLLPDACRIAILPAQRQAATIPGLVTYLQTNRPDLLITNMEHMSIMALLARRLARSSTRIIVTQHITLARPEARNWKYRLLPWLYRRALPHADAIVAVSHGVANELTALLGEDIPISVIHNGISAPPPALDHEPHAWLAETAPVILGVGRLVPQKDFPTLLHAFAKLPDTMRLILLGEGPQRIHLKTLAASLGLAERVAFTGFVQDPTPYLARANVLALSSVAEGFGNVIVEAFASGTPVVSTACPHGPAEILKNGRYGRLVPMNNPAALATAIADTLRRPLDPHVLQSRAAEFSIEVCAENYHRLFSSLLSAPK